MRSIRIKRELGNHNHRTTHILQRKIHQTTFIRKKTQHGNPLGDSIRFRIRIGLRDAQKNQVTPIDSRNAFPVDCHRCPRNTLNPCLHACISALSCSISSRRARA